MSTRSPLLGTLARIARPPRDHIGLAAAAIEHPVDAVRGGASVVERLAARRRADDTTAARLSRPL